MPKPGSKIAALAGITVSVHVMLLLAGSVSAEDVVVDGGTRYQSIAGSQVTILEILDNPNGFGATPSAIGQQLTDDFGFEFIKIRDNLRDFEPVNDNSDPLTFDWDYYNSVFGQQKFVDWFQAIKAMYDAGARLHLSVWHWPDWMHVPGGHTYKLDPGYPRPELYQEIAELWAAILVHLRDVYGGAVEYVVAANEPLYGEPMQFTQTEFLETVKAVGDRFASENLSTKILVSDDNSISQMRTTVHAVLGDAAAAPYARGISYHPYDSWPDRTDPDKLVSALQGLASDATIAASGLDLWMTEWSIVESSGLRHGLAGAKLIYNCHTLGRTSVVDLWYLGPLSWSGDLSNIIENDGTGNLGWRKQMYAWKQFAKFIEPGSQRIDVSPTVPSGTATPAVSAYLHPVSKRLTIVAINRASSANTVNVSLQNLAGYGPMEVHRTSASENAVLVEGLTVTGDAFTYDLPAESITTFVVEIGAGNNAPEAADDVYGAYEDSVLTMPAPGVLANDSDADGDTLTAVWVSGPSSGTLALNADGSFTYAPHPDFTGEDSFTYQASDGKDQSNVATVTIIVTTGVAEIPPLLPQDWGMLQNYPNPFNNTTVIRYHIAKDDRVLLRLFSITGEAIRTLAHGVRGAGANTELWDGRDDTGEIVASGIYLCRIEIPGLTRTNKMVLIR